LKNNCDPLALIERTPLPLEPRNPILLVTFTVETEAT
jgi:hypothetical protein